MNPAARQAAEMPAIDAKAIAYWKAPGIVTKPQGNYENPRCYARELGNCSTTISREHYISRSLLLEMGGKPEAAGLTFIEPGTQKSLGVEALTSKILCQEHNSGLSPLDAEATRLFRALREFDSDLRDGNEAKDENIEMSGSLVELWMLKLLAGLVHARVISASALRRGSPWLEILFGQKAWPDGWGLYLLTAKPAFYSFDGVDVTTHTHEDEIWAAEVGLAGFSFEIALGRLEAKEGSYYRPAGLVFRREDQPAKKTVRLAWPSGPSSGVATFTRTSQYNGPRPQDRGFKKG